MEIPHYKTKFRLFSGCHFKSVLNISTKQLHVSKILLHSLSISSNSATFSSSNSNNKFLFRIDYTLPSSQLLDLLSPIAAELKAFTQRDEKGLIITKDITPRTNFNYKMTFFFNENDILHMFYTTTKNVAIDSDSPKVFFILTSINYNISYILPNKPRERHIDLFVYKNGNNELDNMKYQNIVIKISLTKTMLLKYILSKAFKNKFFLGNDVYKDNIIIIDAGPPLNQLFTLKLSKLGIDFIFLSYSFITAKIITYYEFTRFIDKYDTQINELFTRDHVIGYKSLRDLYYINGNNINTPLYSRKNFWLDLLEVFNSNSENLSNSTYEKDIYKEIEAIIFHPKTPGVDLVESLRIDITGYSCYIPIPSKERSNRIMRKYSSRDKMIRVSFKSLNSKNNISTKCKISKAYLISFLKRGLFLYQTQFDFFGYSNSQFRNMSCWGIHDAMNILRQCGDFSKIKSIAKYGARVGQTLSSTQPVLSINKKYIRKKDDFYTNKTGMVGSDGCAPISLQIAGKIAKKLKGSFIPSCFQGRFKGNKGVWSTYDNNRKNIYYRPSMEKFIYESSNDFDFEVCDISKYRRGYLNRQIILGLSTLKVPHYYFLNILYKNIEKIVNNDYISEYVHIKIIRDIMANISRKAVKKTSDLFFSGGYQSTGLLSYNLIQDRAKGLVEKGTIMKGIVDEYNILKKNQAFAIVSSSNNPNDPSNIHGSGYCIVTRCPCVHPGDIRKIKFVKYDKSKGTRMNLIYYEKICQGVNVIIFPSKGNTSGPNEMGGGDGDGDDYYVFWDEELIKIQTVKPFTYPDSKATELNREIKSKDVIEHFINYNSNITLGQLANIQLAVADNSQLLANDPKAIELAELFAKAVDAPKTGVEIRLPKDVIKMNVKYPHYLKGKKDKNKIYHSNSIGGMIHDKINDWYKDNVKHLNMVGVKDGGFIDYKAVMKWLISKNDTKFLMDCDSSESNIGVSKLIRKLPVALNSVVLFNKEMNKLGKYFNTMKYEDGYVGNVKKSEMDGGNERYYDMADYVGMSITKEVDNILKLMTHNPVRKRAISVIDTSYEEGEMKCILSVLTYNITSNINEFEQSVQRNKEIIVDFFSDRTRDFDGENESQIERCYNLEYDESVLEYENYGYGYHCLDSGDYIETKNWINYGNVIEWQESVAKDIVEEGNEGNGERVYQCVLRSISEIKNNSFGRNIGFPYLLFCNGVIALKNTC